jgi:glycosyltransferase involved in cell wall biosynthesis
MPSKICAVIIAKDEEERLPGCIRTLVWCDSIHVFDSGSRDRTVEVARGLGARVVELPFRDFSSLRNAALDHLDADCEWILFVDADERVSPKLRAQIISVCAENDPRRCAWTVSRRNYLLGRWVQHSGWHPDNVPRLFRKGKVRYGERLVHEEPIVDGNVGALSGALLHFTCEKVSDLVRKLDLYSDLEARALYEGRTEPIQWGCFPSPKFLHSVCKRIYDRCPFLRPLILFSYYYFFKLGFLDGYRGFLIAAVYGFSDAVLSNAKAWELELQTNRARTAEAAVGEQVCA